MTSRPTRIVADAVVSTPGSEPTTQPSAQSSDPSSTEHRSLDIVDGRIAARSDRIAARSDRIAARSDEDLGSGPEVLLEAPGTVAVPSLANGHDHGRPVASLAFGAVDGPLESWITAIRTMPRLDPESGAVAFFGRLLASGFTAAMHFDRPAEPQALVDSLSIVGRTAATMGMATAIAVPMVDRNNLLYTDDGAAAEALRGCGYAGDPEHFLPGSVASVDEQLATVDAIAEELSGDINRGRVTVQYGPMAPQWVSDELLEAVADASKRTGRRIHMHLLETARQREWADREYPSGLVRHLDGLGLLSDRLSVAHGVWLRPDELELLGLRGVSVVVNSSSNLRLRSGIAPMASMLAAGVGVATGLDGLGFDDDTDGFRETRLAHRLQAGTGLEDAVSAGDCFHAAMNQSHRVIRGIDGPWGFPAGAPADVVLVDRDRLRADLVVDIDDAELIRTRATTAYVKHVIADGRVVVRDGQVITADLDRAMAHLREQMLAAAPELAARADDIADLQQAQRRFYSG